MTAHKFLVVAIFAACAIGCSKPEAQKSHKSCKAVEDVVGATTIKQGEAIKKRLKEFEKAQEEREKELEKIK